MPSAVPAPFVLSTPTILIGAAPTDLAGIELCESEWPVFAADGGVHMALANHLDPRAVIGDMDSISALDQLDPAIKLIHQIGQDDTDFEKCLYSFNAPYFLANAFLGKRIDHSFATISTIVKMRNKKVILLGKKDILFHIENSTSGM